MKLKQNNKYTSIAIYAIVVFAACLLIYKFAYQWDSTTQIIQNVFRILSPIIIGLLVAYFISPMVNFFERMFLNKVHIKDYYITSTKLKRVLSILLSYIVMLGTVSILMSFVIPQVIDSVSEIFPKLQEYSTIVMEWAKTGTFEFNKETYYINFNLVDDYLEEYLPSSLAQLSKMITDFAPNLISFTTGLAKGLLNIFLGLMIAIYLLFNKESYTSNSRKVFTALLPSTSIGGFFKVATESHKIFTGFFIGKLIDSFIIGVLCFIIMLIFKIPYAVLISVIVGVTNMIPYFGPFIGGGIGIIFLLIGSPIKALVFAIIVLVLQQFDGNILGPKILGDSTGLTPFWVIFAILVFGGMFGIMGMFIGVPCFAVIKNIFDNIIDRKYRLKMQERRLAQGTTDETKYRL